MCACRGGGLGRRALPAPFGSVLEHARAAVYLAYGRCARRGGPRTSNLGTRCSVAKRVATNPTAANATTHNGDNHPRGVVGGGVGGCGVAFFGFAAMPKPRARAESESESCTKPICLVTSVEGRPGCWHACQISSAPRWTRTTSSASMVSAALVVGLQLQTMHVQVGLFLTNLMLKVLKSLIRRRKQPPPRVPVDRSGIFAAYYNNSAHVFLTDVGLTHRAFDEVLRRIEPRIKREYTLKGHGGSLEPGLKLMIALRWPRGSRMSDFKDIFKCGTSTAKKALWEVMGALVEGCGDAVRWPQTE
ncbi:hypothetical protein T492DRAFT_238481 [Pavlovales sp. CCMP2436]|nr:hypothetical protein T492DRAFT_238481 [Pavlovales sp. CCMP2436]